MRKLTIILLMVALVFALTGAGLVAQQKKVVVGNKNFTEEYIVGQLMKQILEDRGFQVELVSDISTMALRAGMEAGDIDISAEYTGTAWMVHLGHAYAPGVNNIQLYDEVKYEEVENDFKWLCPMWNNNTYAMASWPEYVEEHNLKTLSDLAAWYNENDGKVLTFIDFEYSVRPDGLPALEEFYGFHVDEAYLKTGAPGASLLGLANHEVDVAMVFGTDAAIAKYGWHVYIDDKSFFPPYDLTPYVRAEVLEEYPEIGKILQELTASFPCGELCCCCFGLIPQCPPLCNPPCHICMSYPEIGECVAKGQKVWQALNKRVDIDKLEPDEAAHEYLVEHNLIGG